jgi:multidrug efflux pump subunit AcrB
MKPRAPIPAGILAAAALALCAARPALGFLGVADTSFVTVIANPAEAANWAAELENLNSQLAAARGTLQTVGDLRAFAGDPRAAVAALRDLAEISGALRELSSGGQTEADLQQAWQGIGAAQRLLDAAALLQKAGPGASMDVFGQAQARDPALYARFARDAQSSLQIRGQIADEQAARTSVASELTLAWSQFRAAPTESSKQAILAEISQLQSQDQVMDARRRAILDDLSLSDRQERNDAAVRSRAADEQALAESSLLNAGVGERARGAEAQRIATLQKTASAPAEPDYTGMRLWTTADAQGGSN